MFQPHEASQNRLVLVVERLPGRLVHQQLADRRLLMPAWIVVVLGDLIEAEVDVHVGHRELGGVDHAALERRVDVGAGEQLGRHPHLLHDLGAEAEEAHLQALELVERLHRFLEPARGLGTDHVAVERVQIAPGVDLVLQVLAAAIDHPGEIFAEARPERHRGEKGKRRMLAGVIAGGGEAGFDRTLGRGIEALQRRHQRAGLEELEREVAARDPLDHRLQPLGRRAEMRQVARERALHLPAHALLRTAVGRAEPEGGDERHAGGRE